METGVLRVVRLGGTSGGAAERIDIAGLPAEVDRTDGGCSTKFRPNY